MISFQTKAQLFEIDGKAKVMVMDMENSCDSVVVRLPDGTLALRDVSTISGGGGTPQMLSSSNDTIFLTDGGFVKLPPGAGGSQTLSVSNDTIFLSDGGFVKLPIDQTIDSDSDPMNEIQTLTGSNDTIFLTNGGFVELPGDGGLPQLLSGSNDTIFLSDGGFVKLPVDQTIDSDSDPTNEIQTLTGSNDTIFLSDGGFVKLPPDNVNDSDSDSYNELQILSTNGDTIFIQHKNYIVLTGLRNLSNLNISVQERIDRGATPFQIYQSGFPLDSLYGKIYAGGYIFYLDEQDTLAGLKGMVASLNDLDDMGDFLHPWGCDTLNDPTPPVTNFPPSGEWADIGQGSSNTDSIVAYACPILESVATMCDDYSSDGYSDWFLPSIQELHEMYNRIGPGAPSPNDNIGDFQSEEYWSSTVSSDLGTWKVNFTDGAMGGQLRTVERRVRAVRTF